MGCNCSKGTRTNGTVRNSVKEKKKFVPLSKANVGGSEERASFINSNSNEATLELLIPSDDAEKERKSSRSVFQRTLTTDTSKVGAKMTRIASVSNGERGAQVVAGWPSWLASVAGEAINGWIPRKADSFERMEKIGQGTYSSVYKARDLETNKIVALKKVRFANMDPESVGFMAREIIILRRLDHPNVMKLEGLITSRVSGSMYLIFEYMEHDLSGLASTPGVKFSEAQIKCYMKQLLHGLKHCHSRGVLHRDIKGSNLLLDPNNNLKIADFGLANFYGDHHQKQPLTSRVVTLWYRPPELLLGSTDYGVTVDLWSTGCILAELFNGKPIMPGRTEVEQLHKIFKLCGSPSEEYWKRSKLSHATVFKPQNPYKRCVAETFKSLPSSALALVEVLLAVEPDARGTTAHALQSEFFTTKPYASDPLSLPKYKSKKETDVKLREEEARRKKGTSSKQNESKQVSRESKAVPAPDANVELLTSIQVHKHGEKFNPNEDAAGFLIEPLKSGTGHNGYGRNGVSSGSSRSPPRKELRGQRSFVQRGAAQLTKFSNSVAARDASHFAIANPRWLEDRLNNNNNGRQDDGDWSQRLLVKPKDCTKDKESIRGYGEKTEKMNYSGPLVSAGGNLDEMLKEHERQIQVAVRKARVDKKSKRDDHGQTQAFLAANGRQMRTRTNQSHELKLLLVCLLAAFILIFIVRSTLKTSQKHQTPEETRSGGCAGACNKLPRSLAQALIHYSTSVITPQQTLKEIVVSSRVLDKKSPCNFLVFGLGHDSLMWSSLNYGGRTVFLEEDEVWIKQIKRRFPMLETYHVSYNSKVNQAENLIEVGKGPECTAIGDPRYSMCQLALKGLPDDIYETSWDLIMVDAPTGYYDEAPGRMTAIYTAGMMARNRERTGETDVFVHDVNREVEDKFSMAFLCEGYMKKQEGRLRHFIIPSYRNGSESDSYRLFCP
ncbi:hypothetical protein DY000_02044842 [Brassica cretica]|uniref:Protein kinase domain-containing protein n=1 Tax=Brassica cretica TaxID=69181 RepID=A0ABQ7F4K0_BRACR|nr:hypothetical protein DY000_02044842 [Brassica cretica]